ncbi:hypothetical protein C4587_01770 [Candidatus Parcubacteria bacterium]|nr:MAG: hypothetical protein C4587_01770 [Candidatus Parcubacteria bacterium]
MTPDEIQTEMETAVQTAMKPFFNSLIAHGYKPSMDPEGREIFIKQFNDSLNLSIIGPDFIIQMSILEATKQTLIA